MLGYGIGMSCFLLKCATNTNSTNDTLSIKNSSGVTYKPTLILFLPDKCYHFLPTQHRLKKLKLEYLIVPFSLYPKNTSFHCLFRRTTKGYYGDDTQSRTGHSAVKGRCLNRLTISPYIFMVARTGIEPVTFRV